MIDTYLVPQNTAVGAKGDGNPVEIAAAQSRVFLATLAVTGAVEQESLDVSIQGSPDGKNWGDKPLLSFPQQFYTAEQSILLDLSAHPEVKFLRARWDVNRWGRGDAAPRFAFQVSLREVPADLLEAARQRRGGA